MAELRDRAEVTKEQLGDQFKELAGKAEELAEKAGEGWKNLMDAGRGQLEEKGHALRQFGDDVMRGTSQQPHTRRDRR